MFFFLLVRVERCLTPVVARGRMTVRVFADAAVPTEKALVSIEQSPA